MVARLKPLSELIPAWGESDPEDPQGVVDADWDSLSPAAQELRRHLINFVKSFERKPITGPARAKEMLEDAHLWVADRKWVTYVLVNRERVLVPTASGGVSYLKKVTFKVPSAEELPACPTGGKYLLIYTGDVEVLSNPGVIVRLRKLQAAAKVADVLIWHRDDPQGATLYSLAAGKGDRGGNAVELPETDASPRRAE